MLLPEDVMSLILLWLPVATLVRFKSVCKSWYSLIQNPSFINQHYNHPHLSNNHENLFVVHTHIYYEDQHLNISVHSGKTDFQEFQNYELPHPSFPPSTPITSYNGVICLQHGEFHKDFALYNPALKEFKILSEPPVLGTQPEYCIQPPVLGTQPEYCIQPPVLGTQSEYCIHGGFGFDCVNNDYRVVRVAEECASDSDHTVKSYLVDVYSLSTGVWRNIDAVVVPGTIAYQAYKTPVRDGRHYCWLAAKGTSAVNHYPIHYIIISFDFSKEVFDAIPLPYVYDIEANFELDLVSFNDNISCVETVRDMEGDKFVLNVWLLKEYGVKESWTKLYTTCVEHSALPPVYHTSHKVIPTTFLNNGDIIWLEDVSDLEDRTTLYLWDHVTCGKGSSWPTTLQHSSSCCLQGEPPFSQQAHSGCN